MVGWGWVVLWELVEFLPALCSLRWAVLSPPQVSPTLQGYAPQDSPWGTLFPTGLRPSGRWSQGTLLVNGKRE